MQYTGSARYQCSCMLTCLQTGSPGFNADELCTWCVSEWVKDADSIASAANTGDYYIGQSPLLRKNLCPCFIADNRLEVAHDARIGMRPDCRTDQVEGGFDIRYPVADGLV